MTRFIAGWITVFVVGCLLLFAPVAFAETGRASWYSYSGHRTANGERFTGKEMTAAHRFLPFGTRVEVCRIPKGKCVVVRINDRGPFVRGRVIDLSKAAARKLGMLRSGTARVRVTTVR